MADLVLLGRALFAAVLGFMVGWEREAHGHEAGVRTFAIVTMGGSVVTTLCLQTFNPPDRIIANILTGVGFLGAGIIIHADSDKVRGLTSAAGLWTMTGVSIIVGTGRYLDGAVLTAFVLLILWWQYIPGLRNLLPNSTRWEVSPEADAQSSNHQRQTEDAAAPLATLKPQSGPDIGATDR